MFADDATRERVLALLNEYGATELALSPSGVILAIMPDGTRLQVHDAPPVTFLARDQERFVRPPEQLTRGEHLSRALGLKKG